MVLFDRPAPARRPRARGAARAQSLASSRSRRRAGRSIARSRPISTRSRARCDSSACFARNARASSVSSARLRARLRRARGRARTAPGAWRARPPCSASRTTWRHASTTSAFDASSASTSSSRRRRSSPRAIRRAAGVFRSERCAFDLGRQRRDIRVARGALGPRERRARRLRPQAPHRDARDDQLVGGPRGGREGRRVELGERTLGLVEAADQEQAPDLEIARMRGVGPVAVRFERRPRRVERLRGPAEVARDERDLGLGDDAPRAGHGLFRTEGARRTVAAAPSRGRDRRAAPSRCRAARAPARRRAARPGSSAPSGSPAASARAAAVISESIGIPSHLSLPPFDTAPPSLSRERTSDEGVQRR